jgi:pyruvate formate lyase activating enzyme
MNQDCKAPVHKILNHSIVDGRGNRTAVFLQGCNFNCAYCHNPETIDLKDPTVSLTWMTPAEVTNRVLANAPFIRGVTVSGGECTLYPEFLRAFFSDIKNRGKGKAPGGGDLTTLIDSNGSYDFRGDPELLKVTDGILLDVKEGNPEMHRELIGASNVIVLDNLVFLAQSGKLEEIRTVVVPGRTNPEETIRTVAGLLGEYRKQATYRLIKYRPMGVRKEMLKGLKVPNNHTMDELRNLAMELDFGKVIVT